jgi:hypothetical protein
MRNVTFTSVVALLLSSASQGADIDVGSVDQMPPRPNELVAPKSDGGIAAVGLRETIKGTVAKGEKRHLYIVVNPLSNPKTVNTWWTQQEVSRDGESFRSIAQFGEDDAGKGEFFAVLAVATDKRWSVGEMLNGLPDDAAYTKVKIVKRK